jgi:hypothetical protein
MRVWKCSGAPIAVGQRGVREVAISARLFAITRSADMCPVGDTAERLH